MADIKSPEKRSQNMSRIRSRDTKPEVWFRKYLFSQGYRYRKNSNIIPGHPDLWLAKYNVAIFVHGCFWHRHENCKYAYTPKSNVDFWNRKFQNNVERDRKVLAELSELRIRQIIVWECTVKNMLKSEDTKVNLINQIKDFLKSNNDYLEL